MTIFQMSKINACNLYQSEYIIHVSFTKLDLPLFGAGRSFLKWLSNLGFNLLRSAHLIIY